MRRYVITAAVLLLSACATASHEPTATKGQQGSSNSGAVDITKSDRVFEDGIHGGVLGSLVGAVLDKERDDRIHASDVRYHRRQCPGGEGYFRQASQARHVDERIELMEQGIDYCPDNPAAFNDLAVALVIWGDLPEARFYFQRALELDSDYAPSRTNLALITYDVESAAEEGGDEPAVKEKLWGGKTASYHRERILRNHMNSEENNERRRRWMERQNKTVEQNSQYD